MHPRSRVSSSNAPNLYFYCFCIPIVLWWQITAKQKAVQGSRCNQCYSNPHTFYPQAWLLEFLVM